MSVIATGPQGPSLDEIRRKVEAYEKAFRAQSIAQMMSAPRVYHDEVQFLLALIDEQAAQIDDRVSETVRLTLEKAEQAIRAEHERRLAEGHGGFDGVSTAMDALRSLRSAA